ncbi:hypothetical protein [Actinomyces qiguomingii]|nr:hypothetical protein [Actinomyces qiguomingii]
MQTLKRALGERLTHMVDYGVDGAEVVGGLDDVVHAHRPLGGV